MICCPLSPYLESQMSRFNYVFMRRRYGVSHPKRCVDDVMAFPVVLCVLSMWRLFSYNIFLERLCARVSPAFLNNNQTFEWRPGFLFVFQVVRSILWCPLYRWQQCRNGSHVVFSGEAAYP